MGLKQWQAAITEESDKGPSPSMEKGGARISTGASGYTDMFSPMAGGHSCV